MQGQSWSDDMLRYFTPAEFKDHSVTTLYALSPLTFESRVDCRVMLNGLISLPEHINCVMCIIWQIACVELGLFCVDPRFHPAARVEFETNMYRNVGIFG